MYCDDVGKLWVPRKTDFNEPKSDKQGWLMLRQVELIHWQYLQAMLEVAEFMFPEYFSILRPQISFDGTFPCYLAQKLL